MASNLLNVSNAAFQKIWLTIAAIPQGKVVSYGQVADLAGFPGRARMVARALRMVPCDMVLPWYRVLRSNGQLAPQVAERQKELLQEENVEVIRNRVNLALYQWKPSLADILFILEG